MIHYLNRQGVWAEYSTERNSNRKLCEKSISCRKTWGNSGSKPFLGGIWTPFYVLAYIGIVHDKTLKLPTSVGSRKAADSLEFSCTGVADFNELIPFWSNPYQLRHDEFHIEAKQTRAMVIKRIFHLLMTTSLIFTPAEKSTTTEPARAAKKKRTAKHHHQEPPSRHIMRPQNKTLPGQHHALVTTVTTKTTWMNELPCSSMTTRTWEGRIRVHAIV